LWVAENDLDNRIPAGHAAFFNSSSYTRFGYTSEMRAEDLVASLRHARARLPLGRQCHFR
jgi:hypothetical protein